MAGLTEPTANTLADVTIYTADARDASSWTHLVKNVVRERELIWRFFARDFSARYEQSLLGYAWSLGPPLVTTAIFTILARNRVLAVGDTELPYPVFLLLGLTVWGLFSGALTAITSSLTAAGSIIKKMNFLWEALIFAALGQPLFDMLVRCLPLAFFLWWYGVPVTWTVIFLPFIWLLLLVLTVGLGFWLATFNALVRDVSSALALILYFAMFLTPVVYPAPTTGALRWLNYLNPVSAFVIASQDVVTRGALRFPWALVTSSLFGLVMLAVGWRVFKIAQPIIGERM